MDQSADAMMNSPFEYKGFSFKRIGMGKALADIGRWITEKRIEEIKLDATAFDDPKDKAAFLRERLILLPKKAALNKASLTALLGDDTWRESRGENGDGPEVTDEMVYRLIKSGLVTGKGEELDKLLPTLSPTELVRLCYRVLDILDEGEAVRQEAGGEPEKK